MTRPAWPRLQKNLLMIVEVHAAPALLGAQGSWTSLRWDSGRSIVCPWRCLRGGEVWAGCCRRSTSPNTTFPLCLSCEHLSRAAHVLLSSACCCSRCVWPISRLSCSLCAAGLGQLLPDCCQHKRQMLSLFPGHSTVSSASSEMGEKLLLPSMSSSFSFDSSFLISSRIS